MIHAENQDIIYKLREKMKREGRMDLAAWTEHRPAEIGADGYGRFADDGAEVAKTL